MNIALLLITIAVLDVLMVCYSLYLDRQIAKLKGIASMAADTSPAFRMGRFERFVHSPLGTLVLAVCFIGSLIAMREAEKHEGSGNAGHGSTVHTVPEGQLTTFPCTDIPDAKGRQLAGR